MKVGKFPSYKISKKSAISAKNCYIKCVPDKTHFNGDSRRKIRATLKCAQKSESTHNYNSPTEAFIFEYFIFRQNDMLTYLFLRFGGIYFKRFEYCDNLKQTEV